VRPVEVERFTAVRPPVEALAAMPIYHSLPVMPPQAYAQPSGMMMEDGDITVHVKVFANTSPLIELAVDRVETEILEAQRSETRAGSAIPGSSSRRPVN
jgi:hypothetical protein